MKEMSRIKKTRIGSLLAGILLLCAAFWFLNFHMASSNTQSDKTVVTTGIGDRLPDSMQYGGKIILILEGNSPLIALLQEALAAEMSNAGIGEIELGKSTEPKYNRPVLLVNVEKTGVLWTPFYATSDFAIQAGYISSGDTTFMSKTPVTVDNQDGPVLNMYSEYNISDTSWGVISRRGYYQILADYLARQIGDTLRDLYKTSAG